MRNQRLPLILLAILLARKCSAYAESPQVLADLRQAVAMNFTKPEPNLRLARYHLEQGNRLIAFYIAEEARRRIPPQQFDAAFAALMQVTRPGSAKQTEAELLRKSKEDPNSCDLLSQLGELYASREEWVKADEYFKKALAVGPNDLRITSQRIDVLRRLGKSADADALIAAKRECEDSERDYLKGHWDLHKSNPEGALNLAKEAVTRWPRSARLRECLALSLSDANKLADAERHFEIAAALGYDLASTQGNAARFFRVQKRDMVKALAYYLSAYFLDPHYYDGEFAEARIRRINWDLAKARVAAMRVEGRPLETMLEDENPVVRGLAIEVMATEWNTKYIEPLIAAMGHDDPGVRVRAAMLLMEKMDAGFEARIRELMKDSDLRKRALAAQMAVRCGKEKSFAEMQALLKEKATLLRFAAISALLEEGDLGGRQLVIAYREEGVEQDPWLKSYLEKVR